jgi:HD-GYP domain-containing protein (c-di-GMP phosphodiesterase class II)
MRSPSAPTDLRLAEMIAALSVASDLGMGMPMEYALRSAVLAVRLGEALGLGEDDLTDVYYVALLRFVGCTADADLAADVFGDELAARPIIAPIDWARPSQMLLAMVRHIGEGNPPLKRAGMLASALVKMPRLMASATAHCEVAQQLAARMGLSNRLDLALGQLFERWDGRGIPNKLAGDRIALSVRVAFLAQDMIVHHDIGGVEAAVAVARERSGGAFDPRVVEVFSTRAETLMADLGSGNAWELALTAEPGPRPRLTGGQLDEAVKAMADFTDLKSHYFAGHSSGVAALAEEAARRCGLPPRDLDAVRRAGHLHDLGRIGVSAAVWHKTGPLSDGERERVRLHPYYTERILSRPQALARLGALAAHHHERLDGSGYHRGAAATSLSPAARILAAADVYQALTEPRPHRDAFPQDRAAEEVRREVRAGRLDGDAAGAVLAAAGHRVRAARRAWPAGLSDREVEVLGLIARGCSNKEMAKRLVIAEKTIDHHVQHIYAKLGVSTRAAATLFAMQHDLVR